MQTVESQSSVDLSGGFVFTLVFFFFRSVFSHMSIELADGKDQARSIRHQVASDTGGIRTRHLTAPFIQWYLNNEHLYTVFKSCILMCMLIIPRSTVSTFSLPLPHCSTHADVNRLSLLSAWCQTKMMPINDTANH